MIADSIQYTILYCTVLYRGDTASLHSVDGHQSKSHCLGKVATHHMPSIIQQLTGVIDCSTKFRIMFLFTVCGFCYVQFEMLSIGTDTHVQDSSFCGSARGS